MRRQGRIPCHVRKKDCSEATFTPGSQLWNLRIRAGASEAEVGASEAEVGASEAEVGASEAEVGASGSGVGASARGGSADEASVDESSVDEASVGRSSVGGSSGGGASGRLVIDSRFVKGHNRKHVLSAAAGASLVESRRPYRILLTFLNASTCPSKTVTPYNPYTCSTRASISKSGSRSRIPR